MMHIINYSGGIASWGEAHLTITKYGAENTVLVFADTKTEDEDLYRFLDETVADFGCEFVRLAEGRDIWGVFEKEKFLGNSRTTPCSRMLKRDVIEQWRDGLTTSYTEHFGFYWDESHRLERLKVARKTPVASMLHDSRMVQGDLIELLTSRGIEIPRLYKMGLAHNNCGGGCVKAGRRHWLTLLAVFPERYAQWEANEQKMQSIVGRPVTMLKNGLSLKNLRHGAQSQGAIFGDEEFSGCGCFETEYMGGDDDAY
jgi:hypothetical protein